MSGVNRSPPYSAQIQRRERDKEKSVESSEDSTLAREQRAVFWSWSIRSREKELIARLLKVGRSDK